MINNIILVLCLLAILGVIGILVFTLGLDNPVEDTLRNRKLGLMRELDEEAGVVCWTFDRNGIDCLPIEETQLKVGQ